MPNNMTKTIAAQLVELGDIRIGVSHTYVSFTDEDGIKFTHYSMGSRTVMTCGYMLPSSTQCDQLIQFFTLCKEWEALLQSKQHA